MIYLVVTLTIYDGEFEYNVQSPVKRKGKPITKEVAEEYASTYLGNESKKLDNGNWEERCGYREVGLDKYEEITNRVYKIITKYIY